MREARIILKIGITEFKGVLSSCATDEKNVALIFWPSISSSLILVTSVQKTMTWPSLLIAAVFTWMYLRGSFDLKIASNLNFFEFRSLVEMNYHRSGVFSMLGLLPVKTRDDESCLV